MPDEPTPTPTDIAVRALLVRLGTLAAFPVAATLVPVFNEENWAINGRAHPEEPATLMTSLATWDAQHYLRLAEFGYRSIEPSSAFYPGFPSTIHIVGRISGEYLTSALLISVVSGALATALLFRLAERRVGASAAQSAVWLWMSAPAAFFLSLPYTESMFALILLWTFDLLDREEHIAASSLAVLLPLFRPIGFFLVLPFAVHAWRYRSDGDVRAGMPFAATLLGILGYFGFHQIALGDPFAGFASQALFTVRAAPSAVFDVARLASSFVDLREIHGFGGSALDRAMFLLVMATLPAVYKLDRRWAVYALVASAIPASTQLFVSQVRYALLAFPSWIVLGAFLDRPDLRPLRPLVLGLFVFVQSLLLVRHATMNWAG